MSAQRRTPKARLLRDPQDLTRGECSSNRHGAVNMHHTRAGQHVTADQGQQVAPPAPDQIVDQHHAPGQPPPSGPAGELRPIRRDDAGIKSTLLHHNLMEGSAARAIEDEEAYTASPCIRLRLGETDRWRTDIAALDHQVDAGLRGRAEPGPSADHHPPWPGRGCEEARQRALRERASSRIGGPK